MCTIYISSIYFFCFLVFSLSFCHFFFRFMFYCKCLVRLLPVYCYFFALIFLNCFFFLSNWNACFFYFFPYVFASFFLFFVLVSSSYFINSFREAKKTYIDSKYYSWEFQVGIFLEIWFCEILDCVCAEIEHVLIWQRLIEFIYLKWIALVLTAVLFAKTEMRN